MADVRVNLAFTADTTKAKAQLQDLQNTLSNLITNKGGNQDAFGLSTSIQKATTAVAQLKATLNSATNIKTGQLDLTKFSQSLEASGMSLKQYKIELEKLGPSGSQAFAKLSTSIMNASVPITSINTKLKEFGVTLRNTAKWQISSSLLHGFMGAIQSAYGYAQDLNESLNNIRIVTGYSVDKMSQFALEANKAAKALSTTTTAYTDASLIYYQQGLNDQEVKERTDVTIKLANVARESATDVSDQMTAVWNNFADGSKSLEYYADVITKLGAATAASNSEIAEGIEKFAAISHTVGLSYEYATSALTTVVDRTRQSADTVGTAFKTMFARIQGLKLGETLDDGTTLNQYSQALQAVGINIKEANGDLKDMDVILDEMGAKWQTLNRDEQVALAQKVAGVRQYQQLISLMENYDFFKENVDLAKNSTGALQEQVDIYAESWEGARKRVKASLEGLYSTILNDEFFIKLNNGFAGAIDWISKFIKSLGGVKTILMAIGGIAVQVFSKDIAQVAQNLSLGLTAKTRAANQQAIATNLKTQATELTGQIAFDKATNEGNAQGVAYQAQAQMQTTLINNAQEYDAVAQNTLHILMDQVNALHEMAIASAKNLDQADAQYHQLQKTLETQRQVAELRASENKSTFTPLSKETTDAMGKANTNMGKMIGLSGQLRKSMDSWGQGVRFTKKEYGDLLNNLKNSAEEIKKTYGEDIAEDFSKAVSEAENNLNKMGKGKDFSTKNSKNVEDLRKSFEAVGAAIDDLDQKVQVKTENFVQNIDTQTEAGQKNVESTRQMVNAAREFGQAEVDKEAAAKRAAAALEEEGQAAENLRNKHTELADKISMVGQVFMSFSMVASALTGIIDTLSNPDLSGIEKFKSILMSVVGMTPMILMSVKTISSMIEAEGFKAQASWGWIGIALAAVSALTVVGISIFQKISNGASETEKKITKLKKEIEDLEEASNNVKNEIEDIKSAINGYDEAVKKLNSCARGTDEWYQALKEVNNIILEIIKNYPDLSKVEGLFDIDQKSGLRTINKDKIKDYLNDREKDANALDIAKIQGQQELDQRVLDSQYEDLANQMYSEASNNFAAFGVERGSYSMAENKIIWQNYLKENIQDFANLTEEEFKNKISSLIPDLDESQLDALAEFQDQINKLANESGLLADSIKTSNELIAQSNIDFQQGDYENGIAGAITSIVGQQIPQLISDESDVIVEKIKNFDKSDLSSERDQLQQYLNEYNRITGQDYKLEKNAIRGSGDNRKIAVTGKDDKTEFLEPEDIANIIGASEALKNLGVAADEARQFLNHLSDKDKDLKSDLVGYISSGNMGDASKFSLNKMKAMNDEEIQNLFGGPEAFAEYAKKLFPDAEDAVQEALSSVHNAINEGLQGINDAFNLTSTTVQEQWKNMNDQLKMGMSENQTKQLANYMQQAFENNGREASQAVADLFNKFGENADEVLSMLSEDGFVLATASTQDLNDAIKKAGLDGAVTAEELQSLATAIQKVGGSTSSLSDIQKTYGEKRKITDGLSQGSTISADDWATLGLNSDLASQYFIEMADGTHKLIGDAEEFQQKVNAINLEPFKEKLESVNSDLQKYQDFENSYRTFNEDALINEFTGTGESAQTFASKQLNYLEESGYQAEGFDIAQLKDTITNGTDPKILVEAYNEIAEAVGRCGDQSELFKQKQIENKAEAEKILNMLFEQQLSDDVSLYGLDEQLIRDTADALVEMGGAFEHNERLALAAATGMVRLNEAVDDLSENYSSKYDKALKEFQADTDALSRAQRKNSDTMKSFTKTLAGLLDVTEDFIDADMLDALDPKDLEKAAKGDVSAIRRISEAMAECKAKSYGLTEEYKNFKEVMDDLAENEAITLDANTEPFLQKLLQAEIQAHGTDADLRSILSTYGIECENAQFFESLEAAQEYAKQTGGIIVDNLSYTTHLKPAESEQEGLAEDYEMEEKIDTEPIPSVGDQLVEGEGVGATTKPIQQQITRFTKTVSTKPITEKPKTVTASAGQEVESGAGDKGKGAVVIDNPIKKSFKPTGGSCFVAGTLITTIDGFKTIEDIKKGDIVLSYNEQTSKNEYSEVLQTMIHTTEESIYKLFIENDILEVTGIHRFYIQRNNQNEWIAAANLNINDKVLFANGIWHKINNIQVEIRLETVYNFEVSGNHNYYVGKNQILAHNKGGGSCFIAGTQISLGESFKNIENIQIGDIVLSYNEQTHKNEYSKVLQTMIHYVNEEIYDLYIENEVLGVTGIHRFYIKQNDFTQWVTAQNLQIGDNVLFANGTWHEIKNIKVSIKLTTVYNFEVANNHNYYVGQNQILAHNKGGGGGGGGKSTPAEKKQLTKKSDVVDRYKQINDKLNTVNKNMDKYNKLSEMAYGKNKLKSMDKILNAYKQQIKLQQQLKKEAEGYLPEDKKNMEAAAADLGTRKLQYDSDGNIKNIEAVQSDIFAKINAAETKYNSFATKEQQDEYNKATLEPLMKQYEEFKDYLSKYEDTKQQIADAEAESLNLQVEYMSKKLENANYKIRLKVEFRQDEIKQFEKELQKLENRAFSTAKRFSLLNAETRAYNSITEQTRNGVKVALKHGIYKTEEQPVLDKKGKKVKNKDGTVKTEQVIVTFDEWMENHGYSKDRRSQVYENMAAGKAPKGWENLETFFDEWSLTEESANALLEYRQTLEESSDALDEIKNKIDNEVLLVLNRWITTMEKHEKSLQHWSNVFNRYYEIIEKVGAKTLWGNNANEVMSGINVQRQNISFQTLKQHQSEYDTNYDLFKKMEQIDKVQADELTKANRRDYTALLQTKIGNNAGVDPTKSYDENITQLLKKRESVENRLLRLQEQAVGLSGEELENNLKEQRADAKKLDEFDQYYHNIEQRKSEIDEIHEKTEQAREEVRKSREQVIEDLLNVIEVAQEVAISSVNNAIDEFDRAISENYGSVENMQKAMELNKRLSSEYVQDYEKVYQLTKLNRDLEKKMGDTTNLKAKEKLAKYQETIMKYAKEGVKMSQYELDIMQKEYDLEVAKIALEEAQNAKTQVRLTRDSEGNYSYTYTADEYKTSEAQQNYEDKMNEIFNFNNEYSEKMLNAQLDATKQMEDALRELGEQEILGYITKEEYDRKKAEISAWYSEQYSYYAAEIDKASRHNMKTYMEDYDTYYTSKDKAINVTKQFNDDLIKAYQEVYKEYENAQIKRDAEIYNLNRAYASGSITLEQYLAKFQKANKDYTTETEVADKLYKSIMETTVKGNNANAESIKNGLNGIILHAKSTFLPDHKSIWQSAAADAEGFVKELVGDYSMDDSGKVSVSGNSLIGKINGAINTYTSTVGMAVAEVGGIIDPKNPENTWKVFGDLIVEKMTGADNKITELSETVTKAGAVADTEMTEAANKTISWYETSYPYWDSAKTKIDNVTSAINSLIGANSDIKPIKPEADTTAARDQVNALTKDLKDLHTAQGKVNNNKVQPAADTSDAKGKADKYNKSLTNTNGSIDTLNGKTAKPKANTTDAKKKIDDYNKSLKESINLTEKLNNATPQAKTQSSGGGSKSTQGDGKFQVGDKVKLLSNAYYDSYGTSPLTGNRYTNTTVKIDEKSSTQVSGGQWRGAVGKAYIHVSTLDGGDLGWVREDQISGYDTGGYTGKWGPDGRLALLHQKELILNAKDTENMLAAVKTVREIAAMVDLQAQQANLAGQYALALGQLPSSRSASIDQNVHITAEFPNIQDHNEVELALTSLVNRASQFAWRN